MAKRSVRSGGYIAAKRVEVAFGPSGDAVPGIILGTVADPNTSAPVLVRVRIPDGAEYELVIQDPFAFGAALDRDDLTRIGTHAVALVNRKHQLIAIAIGPAVPPNRLEVSANVVRLEGERGAVEIPGIDDQPSWLIFELKPSQ